MPPCGGGKRLKGKIAAPAVGVHYKLVNPRPKRAATGLSRRERCSSGICLGKTRTGVLKHLLARIKWNRVYPRFCDKWCKLAVRCCGDYSTTSS